MRHPHLSPSICCGRCSGAYAQITSPPRLRPAPAPALPPIATGLRSHAPYQPGVPHAATPAASLSTATGAGHEPGTQHIDKVTARLAHAEVVDGALVIGIIGDVGWI